MSTSQRRRYPALAAMVVAIACLLCAESAVARLKTTAPKDVSLSGAWKINPALSESPYEAMEERRRQARARMEGVRSVAAPTVGGILGGIVGAVLGGVANRDPFEGERDTFQQLVPTREHFEIEQQARELVLKRIGGDTESCKTGEKKQVFLPNGEPGTQRCGWEGKAFVVELKLPNGFMRTERYQLAVDGPQLEITTDIKGPKGPMSSFKFKRVYDPVPQVALTTPPSDR